jgi:hypothetical protein
MADFEDDDGDLCGGTQDQANAELDYQLAQLDANEAAMDDVVGRQEHEQQEQQAMHED